MGSDYGSRDRASRRHRHRDDEDECPSRSVRDSYRRRRSQERDSDRRRHRSRSKERERGSDGDKNSRGRSERKRSRSPEDTRRGRERDRERDRERHRHRSTDRGDAHKKRRRRSRDGRDRSREDDLDARQNRRKHRDDPDDERHANEPRDRPRSHKAASPLRRGAPLPSQNDSFAVATGDLDEVPKPKQQPNFGTSGLLAAAANTVHQADGTTVTLKYHEPAEARKPGPRDDWKLFVFKGDDVLDTVPLGQRSCWLVGREAAVADLPAEHPSISKQHAVVQFRYVEKRNEFGDKLGRVKPYLIDLESANGTTLNGSKIADSRYVELRDKDMIKFGHSSREYVIMLAPRD